ncbi:MAG TPA: hypothetical protein VLE72_03445 [Candidatus Saccharimonadales bacterium]|nr:hypothetical protein [Candidatus Saccharimonadales bacterium]
MSEQILAILGLPKDCLTLCKAESQFPPAMTAKPVGFTIVPGSKVRWAEGSLNRAHHPKTLLGDGPFEVASLSTQAFLDNGYHLFKLNWVTIRLPSEWPPLLPICFEGQNRPAVLSVEWFEPA